MKKSTLLSFATASAIVLTSAGTFAVWDTMDATTQTGYSLAVGTPITMKVTEQNFTAGTLLVPGAAKETTLTVTPEGLTKGGKVKLSTVGSLPSGVTVEYIDKDDNVMPTEGFTVANDTAQTYKVKVTLNEPSDPTTVAGNAVNFNVKAVLTLD